jgi:hypothetical protein
MISMIKLLGVATIVLVAVSGSCAADAASYSSLYVLKDARGTLWHHRSEALKLAAIRSCGADRNDNVANPELPAVLWCLRARGWVVARTERVEAPAVSRTSAAASGQDDDSSAATSDDDDDDSADVPSDGSSNDDDAQQQAIDQQNSDMEQEELNEQAQSQQQTNDALAQSAEDNMQTQQQ